MLRDRRHFRLELAFEDNLRAGTVDLEHQALHVLCNALDDVGEAAVRDDALRMGLLAPGKEVLREHSVPDASDEKLVQKTCSGGQQPSLDRQNSSSVLYAFNSTLSVRDHALEGHLFHTAYRIAFPLRLQLRCPVSTPSQH